MKSWTYGLLGTVVALVVAILVYGYILRITVPGDIVARKPGMDGAPSTSAVSSTNISFVTQFRRGDGVASPADAAFWPNFRGVNHDNIATTAEALAESWPESGPKRLWAVALGEGYAAPAVWNGRVYVLDYDATLPGDVLRCFSLDDGKEIWRRGYKNKLKRNHGMSRTIPAVSGKCVVTMGPMCHAMCVDAESGDFRWGLDLVQRWNTEVPLWYTGQCPILDGDTAILAPGGKALLVGVDAATGKVCWETPNPAGWKMSHSSVIPMRLHGRKMYVYCAIGGVVGVAAEGEERGKVLWQNTDWNHAVIAPSPVAVGEDRIFLTAGYGEGSMMLKIRNDGGVLSSVVEYKLDKSVFACEQQTPVYSDGFLFATLPKDAADFREQFVCMNADGKMQWSSGKGNRFGLGPFLKVNDKFLVMDDHGMLTLIKATAEGYQPLAKAKVLSGRESWGPMVVAGRRLLVRDFESMVCLDIGK